MHLSLKRLFVYAVGFGELQAMLFQRILDVQVVFKYIVGFHTHLFRKQIFIKMDIQTPVHAGEQNIDILRNMTQWAAHSQKVGIRHTMLSDNHKRSESHVIL